jgi:hypothetical protein
MRFDSFTIIKLQLLKGSFQRDVIGVENRLKIFAVGYITGKILSKFNGSHHGRSIKLVSAVQKILQATASEHLV